MGDAVDRRLRIALIVLSAIGVGMATYLVYIHYAGIKPLCATSGGCERVQSSEWSKFVGIPVADIGLGGYIAILGTLLFLRGELNRLVPMCLILGGFAFSLYLSYAEFFLVKDVCQWCVGSALVMLSLTVLSVWRYLRAPAATVSTLAAP